MKKMILSLILLIGLGSVIFAQQTPKPKPKPDFSNLIGVWKVDLRPTPDAAEYYKQFEIIKIEGNTFVGKFYDTEIQNGKINADWETVYLAFTSGDNSGLYSHFAKIVNGKLEGASHSLGRKFLLPWRAEKEAVKTEKDKIDSKPKPE